MPDSAFMLGNLVLALYGPGSVPGRPLARPGPQVGDVQSPVVAGLRPLLAVRRCFFEQGLLKLSSGPGKANRRPRARLKKCQNVECEIYYPQY